MAPKSPPLDTVRIATAALRLAALRGWAGVTVEAVAKAAKIAPAKLKARFPTPSALVAVIAEEIDHQAFTAAPRGTPHDILFDLLMARFDILQKHRKAILSMADCARHDRALSCALARAPADGAYRLIAAARLKNPPRPVLALGLVTVYSWAFYVWRRDASADMAKTMAAVDRSLRIAGKAAELIKPRF